MRKLKPKGSSMHDSTVIETRQRAGRREWLGLAVLALPTLLMAMDQSVLYLALPRLSEDLGASPTQSLWILDIYGFLLAGFLVTMGNLGDRIGRRRLLMMGAGGFLVMTLLAAYSVNPGMLIAARALMGISGATLMPSTLALITNMFKDAKQRASSIAAWFGALMVGGALGPVVGGILLDHFWWGSVFLIGVPVMILLLVTGPVLLPEYRAPKAGRVDLLSVVLSLATILPVIYGIKLAANSGFNIVSVVSIVVGLAFGAAFALRQRLLTDPLVDLQLFRNRSFRTALLVLMASSVTIGGMYLFVSLYLQAVKGQSPLVAGLWLVPSTLAIVVSSGMTPGLAQRVRPAYLITAGMLITALGYLLLTQVSSSSGLAVLVIGFVIAFFGGGPMGALGPNMVISTVPPERAGAAASISETSNQLGVALGIAVMGSIGTAVYRGQMAGLAPAGTTAAARQSITGAVATAAQLPPPAAHHLLIIAREAFSTGLNIVAVVGAVAFVGLAALVAIMLRQVTPAGEGSPAVPGADSASLAQEDDLTPAEVTTGSHDRNGGHLGWG
jgi:DHA2 family multidrug resistance protein-like MFS transporter